MSGQKPESDDKLKNLLEEIVERMKLYQAGQENLAKQIQANREAVGALAQLLNNHTQLLEPMRDMVIKLWIDRYGEEANVPDLVN